MPRRRGFLVRAFVSGVTLAYLRVAAWTPLGLNRAVARPLGRILALMVPRVRRVAFANLDRAYGDRLDRAEKQRIFRGAVDNAARVAAEFPHLAALAGSGDTGIVTVEGAELLEPGQGYLCLVAHIGNWELMGPFMATSCGLPVAGVVRPLDDPRVNRAIDRIRTSGNVTTIPKDRAAGEVLRLLKEGYVVGILADQSPRDNGVPVTFFGSPCWATVAPAMIAFRARVPVVPASLTRIEGGRYRLRIRPPIVMERTGNLRADLIRNSQRCQDAIEEMVRESPEQWLWMHRRWKERPRLAEEWRRRAARDK